MKISPIILALLVGCASAVADDPNTASTDKVKSTQVEELADGVVDPYNPPGERTRFFKSAGPDNELDANEFDQTRGKEGHFARRFDNWRAMQAFDKNRSNTIDWFEADAYRKAIREGFLKSFDADEDGKFSQQERAKLNQALAKGRLPLGRNVVNGRRSRRGRQLTPEQIKEYDQDGDGKLSREERRKAWQAFAEKRREEIRKAMLEKYDADGDGELSQEEREKQRTDLRKRMQDRMEQALAKRFDEDGDGVLSEDEAARMEEAKQEMAKRAERLREQMEHRRKEFLEKYDADGDGELSRQERRAGMRAEREAWRKRMVEAYDKDGDGELSDQERRAGWRAEREKRWIRMFDKDKDGQLSEEEKAKMEKARERMRERMRRWRERRNNRPSGQDDSPESSDEDDSEDNTVILSPDGKSMVVIQPG
jgi:Ca2+-binding EF-hand superfamily protein